MSEPAWEGFGVAFGAPAAKGSHKIRVRNGRAFTVHDDDRLEAWETQLILSMRRTRPPEPIREQPIMATMTVYLNRPQSHYRTGRYAGQLKPGAPDRPVHGRDIDKVLRAALDSATKAGWWKDDDLVGEVYMRRRWADAAGERTELRAQVAIL